MTHTLGTTRPTHRPNLKWRRSAPTQRRAPRVLSSGALRARCSVCGSTTASSAAPAGVSSEFTASYLRLRSSLSCLIVRPCSHVRRSYLGYRHHFTSLTRRHVAVRLSQGNVARRSLAPWMLVLLSNPGGLWQPAATTCGVSIRTLVLICLDACSAVSSRRAPRVCLASALLAYVRVAPARSARTIMSSLTRTIISVPMLIATKARFCSLGWPMGLAPFISLVFRHPGSREPAL